VKLLIAAGLALVVWTAVDPLAFGWLIGPGSAFETLLPGTQHLSVVAGIEGVWFFGTLPVLVYVVRTQQR